MHCHINGDTSLEFSSKSGNVCPRNHISAILSAMLAKRVIVCVRPRVQGNFELTMLPAGPIQVCASRKRTVDE